MNKSYEITFWADGYGLWRAKATFPGVGLGNTGEAQRIVYNAMATAKKVIRREIRLREAPHPVRRLQYLVVANEIDHMNRIRSITIGEK